MKQSVIPQLRMTRAARSLPFYVDGLGFAVDWEHRFEPGLPLFAQLSRQGQTIFLTEHMGDCQPGGAVYFWVDDAAACHGAFTAAGITTLTALEHTDYGTLEFTVTDPDGNRLRFGTDLEPDD